MLERAMGEGRFLQKRMWLRTTILVYTTLEARAEVRSMGPIPGEREVLDGASASTIGDQVCWEGLRDRVTEDSSECDLIVNRVGTGLHVSVFSEPYFEDLGQTEAERK